MDFLTDNIIYIAILSLIATNASLLYMVQNKLNNSANANDLSNIGYDPKLTFGASENIISNYIETFYSINIQHFIDDRTNEILPNEYVEYKTKFIKSFMELHGESKMLGEYILMCYSSTESFIVKLSNDFDIYLKIKLQDTQNINQ